MSFGVRGGGGFAGSRGGFRGGFRGRGRGGFNSGGGGDDDGSSVAGSEDRQAYDGRRVRQHVERKHFDCGSSIIQAFAPS